jgi:hypothetical protein
MTLSYSREPFLCFATAMDAATFWACHRRAFTHFGGVPGTRCEPRWPPRCQREARESVVDPVDPAIRERLRALVNDLIAQPWTVVVEIESPGGRRRPNGQTAQRTRACHAAVSPMRRRFFNVDFWGGA